MISKVFPKESFINGIGVFAHINLQKGNPILKIDDTRIVTADNPLREEDHEHEYHCDYLAGGKVILMRLPERHINHSCNPNSFVKTINGTRYVFALSDISAGEEITYDYCINSSGDTLWNCNCNSERCRKEVHSDFFHLPVTLQLEYLPLLDSWYIEEYKTEVERLLASSGVA